MLFYSELFCQTYFSYWWVYLLFENKQNIATHYHVDLITAAFAVQLAA